MRFDRIKSPALGSSITAFCEPLGDLTSLQNALKPQPTRNNGAILRRGCARGQRAGAFKARNLRTVGPHQAAQVTDQLAHPRIAQPRRLRQPSGRGCAVIFFIWRRESGEYFGEGVRPIFKIIGVDIGGVEVRELRRGGYGVIQPAELIDKAKLPRSGTGPDAPFGNFLNPRQWQAA